MLLTLIGAYRFAEPPPQWHRARDLPAIDAELVPPPPQAAEAIGEAMKKAEEKLPPVDSKLVNSMIATSGKILLTCRNCTLAGAELSGTLLTYANLEGADMRGANAAGADLRGANLEGADFTRAWGLSNEQLALACGDERTKLPEELEIPRCGK